MTFSILGKYLERTPRSRELAGRAGKVLPSGIVTDTRFFEPYGIYIKHASGTNKIDVDGNLYLDFFGGHGANMLGHSHPAIVAAVQEAMTHGVQYAANHPLEVELAERVVALVPTAEKVRFTGSGTEATMLALRLSRAFTGRRKVVRFASHYHGWHDHAASGYSAQFDGSPAIGILDEIARQTVLLRPNDDTALDQAIDRFGTDIAAFIIEPVGTHFGVVPTSAAFLGSVQAAAQACGALFILDEVLSGFRVNLGGAQALYGLDPDLTTLAKALCGGLPGGAVAGRADVLGLLDFDPAVRNQQEKVLHQGTFTGNPLSMAAGLAMLEGIDAIDGCERANELGKRARDGLNAMLAEARLPFAFYGDFSAVHLLADTLPGRVPAEGLPTARYLARPQPLLNRLRMALNVVGIDVNTKGSALLSAVHDEDDINVLINRSAEAFAMLRKEEVIAPVGATAPQPPPGSTERAE